MELQNGSFQKRRDVLRSESISLQKKNYALMWCFRKMLASSELHTYTIRRVLNDQFCNTTKLFVLQVSSVIKFYYCKRITFFSPTKHNIQTSNAITCIMHRTSRSKWHNMRRKFRICGCYSILCTFHIKGKKKHERKKNKRKKMKEKALYIICVCVCVSVIPAYIMNAELVCFAYLNIYAADVKPLNL